MNNKTGELLKKLRLDKKLTQDELANLIYVDRTAISKWECGKSIPDYDSLTRLSNVFDISINEIIEGKLIVNIKKRKLKHNKIIVIIIMFSLAIVLLFLILYFILNYKKTIIYNINAESKNCEIKNGLLVYTNEKSYFSLGNIDCNKNIEKIEIYFKETDKDLILIDSQESDSILLFESNGYNEYEINKFKYKNNNVYVKIYFDNNEELIKLDFQKDYINKSLLPFKVNSISDDYLPSEKGKINDDILKLKEKLVFDKNENGFVKDYKFKKSKLHVNLDYENSYLVVASKDKYNNESFYIYMLNFNTFGYEDNNMSFSKSPNQFVCNSKSCDGYENIIETGKEIYNFLINN
jgi:putative helix-turn-helix protein